MTGCEELNCLFLTQMVWANSEKERMSDFLSKQNGNVFLLQETHWPSSVENTVRSQWGCECVAENGRA